MCIFLTVWVNKIKLIVKGQPDDIKESAILEGYRCEDDRCSGFLLRDSGMWIKIGTFIE